MKLVDIISQMENLGKEIDRHRMWWMMCAKEEEDRDDRTWSRATLKMLDKAKSSLMYAMYGCIEAREAQPDVFIMPADEFDPSEGMVEVEIRVKARRIKRR